MINIMQHKVTLAKRLKSLRLQRRLTQEDVATRLNISRPAYAKYESAKSSPDVEGLATLADLYGVTLDFLIGFAASPESATADQGHSVRPLATPLEDDMYQPGPMVLLPVYEEVAAGAPCFADERPVGHKSVDAERVQHDLLNYILVRVKGDSMVMEGIMPGGLVLVHRQEEVEDNQIAVIRIRSDGTTIKRVRWIDGGRVMLIPANPTMREEIYQSDEVIICGRVIQAITDFE